MTVPLIICREVRKTLVFRNGAVELELGSKSTQAFRTGGAQFQALNSLVTDRDVRAVLLNIKVVELGWAELQALRELMQKNREAGKILFVQLYTMDKRALYLASVADTVWMLPTAELLWTPSGMRRLFWGALFQRLGLRADVEAAGAYKSAGEDYSRQFPSSENREQLNGLIGDLEDQMVAAVAESRGIAPAALQDAFLQSPISAERAVELGLIDGLRYEDQATDRVSEFVMSEGRPMSLRFYSKLRGWEHWFSSWGDRRPQIAVLHLNGVISDNEDGAGITVSAAQGMLERVEASERCKAIVLLVNSPGGSALASDRLHRLIEQSRGDRVLVACFANVAASGGYYLAAAANAIVAQPGTITGSIGVVGGKMVVGGALSKMELNAELFGHPESDFMSPYRPFTDDQRARFRAFLQRTYNRFLEVVAGGRMMPIDAVDAVAQGRVWTGRQALKLGLVDQLGGLDVAISEACRRVSLEQDQVKILHLRARRPLRQRIRQKVGASLGLNFSSTASDAVHQLLSKQRMSFLQELQAHPLEPMMMMPECDQIKEI